MKKQLKIAIFHLAFIYSGGGEKLVLDEAIELKKRGHMVEIFAPVANKKNCFPDLVRRVDIKTFLPQTSFVLNGHESFWILLTCVLAPLFSFKFRNFDVVFAANQPSVWIAWVIKRLFGVPYVSYLAQPTRFLYPRKIDQQTGLYFSKKATNSLSVLLMYKFKKLIAWADKKSIGGSDMVLTNGDYIKNIVDRVYGVNSFSLPACGHSFAKVKDYRRRLVGKFRLGKRELTKPYLLITNRHFAQKRFEYGILALSGILREFPQYSLLITGQPTDYTDELRSFVRRVNLIEKVKFLGYVKQNELETLYRNAAIYLYTAPEEDFGMGIVEAMLASTPVVAWDNAGPSKILTNGKNGLLARPFQMEDFSLKVLKLAKDKNFAAKIAKQAYISAKKKYTLSKHIKKLNQFLLNIAKRY